MNAREQIEARLRIVLRSLSAELESQGIEVSTLTATYSVGYEGGSVFVRAEKQDASVVAEEAPKPGKRKKANE